MIKSQWIQIDVAGKTMGAYLAEPEAAGPHPALLVLQEAFGVTAHMRDVTERYAREGFVAICPELFHRTAPHRFEVGYDEFPKIASHYQAVTPETLKADLTAAHHALTKHAKVDATKTASVGYCMGGRASFYANSFLPLKAAASYYGGGIAQGYLSYVKDFKAPILMCWGGKDQHIPAEQRNAIEQALIDAKKPYIQTVFSEAEHGFNCNDRASYHEASAKEAWTLTLEFFHNHLN